MERTKLYTKEEIADALGISVRLTHDRIKCIGDDMLIRLYDTHKCFSTADYEYILKRIHDHLGLNDSGSDSNRGGKFEYVRG